MDKSCHSSGDSTTNSSSSSSSIANNINNRDHYLKHLNKLSHKISKPSSTTNTPPLIKKPSFDQTQNLTQALPPPQPQPSQPQPENPNQSSLQAQQHQPPVYNINKNDFRDVVQKLTGSPAHERFSAPPPIHQPKPQSSRLQRIRPPPLAHVSNRPPMINCAVPNMNPPGFSQPNHPISGPTDNSFIQRPPAVAPLSPLPPFPAVHAAAESPVSAYMRCFQSSMSATVDSNPKQFSGFPPLAPLVSPRWNNLTAPPQQQPPPLPPPQQSQQQQQQQPPQVSSTGMIQSQFPSSPLPFGCLNSPRSPYALLSPSLLFSPNSGQLGFPLSPTLPVPSPKWRGL
ncbi:VQ motif-containing protein 9-like [Durio zibethinus]|uniref:VQ motif-containing protein 9-like n=1 Tax=Durio zibethinus TaxID=66656 RepID=A0A6P6ANE8_DURZI|nr:VQ motif-containing protein 9-like [Durio zibethinus]